MTYLKQQKFVLMLRDPRSMHGLMGEEKKASHGCTRLLELALTFKDFAQAVGAENAAWPLLLSRCSFYVVGPRPN